MVSNDIGICEKCSENLENSFGFKKLLEANRNELTKYLEKQQTVQIKEEEVWAEDYQITEQQLTTLDEIDFCTFCKSSGSIGMTGLKMPISNYACPSCGRSYHAISLYSCPLCDQNQTSISQFRQHFVKIHTNDINNEFRCFACKLFFFNKNARNIHGQMQHCMDCRKRCMDDKELIIPFEDHDKKCQNRSIPDINYKPPVIRNLVEADTLPEVSSILQSRKDLKVSRVLIRPVKLLQPNSELKTAEDDCVMCGNKLGEQKPPVKELVDRITMKYPKTYLFFCLQYFLLLLPSLRCDCSEHCI